MTLVLALLKTYWKGILIAGLLAFGVVQWKLHDRAKIAEGRALERVRVADSTLAVLIAQKREIDSVFVTDTLRFTKTRETVVTLRDTLNIHDTVQVKVFVERATETINACTALLSSCNTRTANLEAQLTQERSKVAVAPLVSPRSCVGSNAVWGLLGAGAGFLGARR